MLILKSEELFADPQGVVTKVTDFLGIEPVELTDVEVLNAGTYSKSDSSEVEQVRKELRDYFEPYNQKLSELLNRDFMWAE